MHLLLSVFFCLGNSPWAPKLSWPFAWSSTFSFFWFLTPRVLYNPVFRVNRIFCNPAFRVSRIFHSSALYVSQIFYNLTFRVGRVLHNPDFHVGNPTGISYFLLRVANPANPINPSNLIYQSIRATTWANLGNLANLSNPVNLIYLLVCVTILANPVNPTRVMLLRFTNLVNPAVVTQIFSLVRDLCSNTCHAQVVRPDHLTTLGQYHMCSLQVFPVLRFWSRRFALIFTNWLTNVSSIDMNLRQHFAWP
jgi:hypothetical protein